MFIGLKKLVPEPIKIFYHFFQALLGAIIFRFPSRKLKVVGVTGTDGKTTTVYLTHHILNSAGEKVSMVSTVEAKIGSKSIDTGLHVTTPSPIAVQKLLRKMANQGSEYAVLEATSHGLAQERVAFVHFFAGVITNITHEHLDYHKTYDNYLSSKAKILKGVKFRVLNVDDRSFIKIKDKGSGQLVTYGIQGEADFKASDIKFERRKTEFTVTFSYKQKKDEKVRIMSQLPGEYNVYNILAAFALATSVGLDPIRSAQSLATFQSVPGRMQYIDEGQDFDCIVDFAHTPAALEQALRILNKTSGGKIIAVFGCAGERDIAKRPMMGKIATELADYSIFTAEDPRNESVNQIIEQMTKGALSSGGIPNTTFWTIPDRGEAINTAIQSLAKTGDTVAIFGKGHEKSMNIKGVEYPWSDEQLASNALRVRLNK